MMSSHPTYGGPYVWQPTADHIETAHLTAFMREHGIANFVELHTKSVADPAWFTSALLSYLNIRFHKPYEQILDQSAGAPYPQWCVNGEMNIVDSCLDRWIEAGSGQVTALIWENEAGDRRMLTYETLTGQVNKAVNALQALGIQVGDRVGLYMPMSPEIVLVLLALAKMGAIALPLFSGYGATAVATRLSDSGAIAVITADGCKRRGTLVEMKSIADAALLQVPEVKHQIVLRHLGIDVEMKPGRDHWFDVLIDEQAPQARSTYVDPETPLMILYTSGTTGAPKGAVHTHCGFPVKAAQDMAFGTDLHPGDTIYWMTDMGWMMGPWLVFGALILGGTFLLYDGAPDVPGVDRLWRLCADHRVNILGVSPTLIRSLMQHGSAHAHSHDLTHLRLFASTGEPWNPAPWYWLFDEIGRKKRPIINYSGGTEISGGILMGNPITPLKACAFSAPCPGMDVDVFNDQGQPLRGEVGELVIKGPWIGMTRGFWKDPQRYEETYWSRWPDIWVHGDFAIIDEDGSWFILGRSDDTLKVAGKRLGPAEVESILVRDPKIIEAAVIGVPDAIKGTAVVAFCVTDKDNDQSETFMDSLKAAVSAALGKPLAPSAIHFLPDLPKTRNAKVMRRMLRAAYLGDPPGDTSALVNPDILKLINDLRKEK
jgi:acetyl-CoA synthetase